METIRLSEASARTTAALAALDGEALQALIEHFNQVAAGVLQVAPEPAGAVRRELRILEGVLATSEQNIGLLHRLRERNARNEWEL